MKFEKKQSDLQVELQVEINKKEFEAYKDKAIESLKSDLEAPGFRKGAVPSYVAINMIGVDKINAEALDDAIQTETSKIVAESKITILTQPKVDLTVVNFNGVADDDVALAYTAKFETYEIKKMPDLSRFKNTAIPPKDGDETVAADEFLKSETLRQGTFTEKSASEEVLDGDRVTITFNGSVGENDDQRLKSSNMPVVLGQGFLVPNFEKAIIGMKTGETKKALVLFPDDYHSKDFAGKNIEFTITVNKLEASSPAELNDEFASRNTNGEVKTYAEFYELVKNYYKEEGKKSYERESLASFNRFLAENSEVLMPEVYLLTRAEANTKRIEEDFAKRGIEGMSFDSYLTSIKKSREQFLDDEKSRVKTDATVFFVMAKIIEEQGFKLDDKDVEEIKAHANGESHNGHNHDIESLAQEALFSKVYEKYLK